MATIYDTAGDDKSFFSWALYIISLFHLIVSHGQYIFNKVPDHYNGIFSILVSYNRAESLMLTNENIHQLLIIISFPLSQTLPEHDISYKYHQMVNYTKNLELWYVLVHYAQMKKFGPRPPIFNNFSFFTMVLILFNKLAFWSHCWGGEVEFVGISDTKY